MDDDRRLYRIPNAAASLDLSSPTVYRLISSGELRAVKLPGGDLRIPASELDAFVNRKLAEATAQTGGDAIQCASA